MKKDTDKLPHLNKSPLILSSIESQKKQLRLLALEEQNTARELRREGTTGKVNLPPKDAIRFTLNNPISKPKICYTPAFAAQLDREIRRGFKRTTALIRPESCTDSTWNTICARIELRETEIKKMSANTSASGTPNNSSPTASVPGSPSGNSLDIVSIVAGGDNSNDSHENLRRSKRITMGGYKRLG